MPDRVNSSRHTGAGTALVGPGVGEAAAIALQPGAGAKLPRL